MSPGREAAAMRGPQTGVEIAAPPASHADEVLTPRALAFVADLHRSFNPRRRELLAARDERQRRLDAGEQPDFLPETAASRADAAADTSLDGFLHRAAQKK